MKTDGVPLLLILPGLLACEDLSPGLYADAELSSALAARARYVKMVVRDVTDNGTECSGPWAEPPPTPPAESTCVGAYPEVEASEYFKAVQLSRYPQLDVFLYAYEDVSCGAIAGGCERVDLRGTKTDTVIVSVVLESSPAPESCPTERWLGNQEACHRPGGP